MDHELARQKLAMHGDAEGFEEAAVPADTRGDEGSSAALSFYCRVDVMKPVVDVLSAIADPKRAKDDTTALVLMESDGLRFCVYDKSKSLQATASLARSQFKEYDLQGGSISCFISLPLLIECLTIFGSNSLSVTTLDMHHRPADGTFSLRMVEDTVVTECEIHTLAGDEEAIDFVAAFGANPVTCRAIVEAEYLRDAFSEILDLPGVSVAQIATSPQAPQLTVAAVGHVGSCDIELGTTTKAFVSFECRTPRAYRYNVRLLQHALRALQVASRTCIRMNEVGMLGFQHKLSHADGTHSFVDCILLPTEDEDQHGSDDDR